MSAFSAYGLGSRFLIFFQGYMIAPMIPRLSAVFGISAQKLGLLISAYLIPYGVSTLLFGLLSDWIGRKRIMFASLGTFAGLTCLTATAVTPDQMIFWRLLTGLGASRVVPLGRLSPDPKNTFFCPKGNNLPSTGE